jgi:hypothetical protein
LSRLVFQVADKCGIDACHVGRALGTLRQFLGRMAGAVCALPLSSVCGVGLRSCALIVIVGGVEGRAALCIMGVSARRSTCDCMSLGSVCIATRAAITVVLRASEWDLLTCECRWRVVPLHVALSSLGVRRR